MLVVDLIIGAVIAAAAVWGLTRGLVGALPLAGFAVGAILGTRVPVAVGLTLGSPWALVVALPAVLILGALLAAVAERFGGRLQRRLRGRERASAAGGGVAAGLAAVVVMWVLGPVASDVGSLRDPVERSAILAQLNQVLAPAGPNPGGEDVPSPGVFPTISGPVPEVAPPDADAETDPDVLAADRSVVKIGVLGCHGGGSGSGWVVSKGTVVTNAHVVSTADAITVRVRDSGAARAATAIWFDPVNDIALLRVPMLRDVPALTMVRRPQGGTSGAVLGFPRGVRDIRRARLGPTTDKRRGQMQGGLPSAFPRKLYGRLVTSFRGRTEPGSSGGPMVDTRGRVLTTTFGGGGVAASSLGVPNEFVRAALKQAGPRVSTGRCPSAMNRG